MTSAAEMIGEKNSEIYQWCNIRSRTSFFIEVIFKLFSDDLFLNCLSISFVTAEKHLFNDILYSSKGGSHYIQGLVWGLGYNESHPPFTMA